MAVCLQADLSNMHVPKRCGWPKPVADVSVALFSLQKLSKFQVENKRKLYFHSKYKLFRCQKMSPRPEGEKKA